MTYTLTQQEWDDLKAEKAKLKSEAKDELAAEVNVLVERHIQELEKTQHIHSPFFKELRELFYSK